MKNYFIILLVLISSLSTNCKKNDVEPKLDLSTDHINFTSAGGSQEITISSNHPWKLVNNSDRINVSALSGTGKNGVITITASENTSDKDETVIVTILSDQLTRQLSITIKQRQPNEMLSFVFPAELNPSYLSKDIVMTIEGNKITGRIPHYTSAKNLIATFTTNGERVKIDNEEQASGTTANDFRQPLTYTIEDSNGDSNEYIVDLTVFTGLPVISIHTDGNLPIDSKDIYRSANIQIDGNGQYDDFEGTVEIKGRGNTTWGNPQKPYKLKFNKKTSLLGEPANKQWVLLANYYDLSNVRTVTAFTLGKISNLDWTPCSHFAELFVNEVYLGTYQLTDQIKIGKDRVNVSDDGFLLEVDQLNRLDPDDIYFQTQRILLAIKDPDIASGSEQYNYIKQYVNDAENALYGSDFTDPETGYAKYLDIESFVDWYLINEITKNNDAIFWSSCYMNLAPNGKLKMGPIWDFDLAFGNTIFNKNQYPEEFWVKTSPWISRLFEDPAFVSKVKERFSYFASHQNDIFQIINTSVSELHWSIIENNAKWETLYSGGGNYAIWGSFDNEIQYLKNWMIRRMEWLTEEFSKM